jgi:hypothetical protein
MAPFGRSGRGGEPLPLLRLDRRGLLRQPLARLLRLLQRVLSSSRFSSSRLTISVSPSDSAVVIRLS